MKNPNRSSVIVGVALGVGLTSVAALMGVSDAQRTPAETQYFVTAEDDVAHLWLREGNTLTMVAHGTCKDCAANRKEEHEHKEGDGHGHAAPAAGGHAGHAEGDAAGDHGHGAALGTIKIGAWTVAVSGEIKAGSEAHLDIALSGSSANPGAVRVWIGSQDGKGAMKQKADGSGMHYHAHTDAPNPIPPDAKLWIEIDDGRGNKPVGGIAIKK